MTAAAAATFNSDDLYSAYSKWQQGGAASELAQSVNQLGQLSITSYYSKIEGLTSNGKVTIDGVSFSGLHDLIAKNRDAAQALQRSFPTVHDLLATNGTEAFDLSPAQFKEQLKELSHNLEQLHSPSLGLVSACTGAKVGVGVSVGGTFLSMGLCAIPLVDLIGCPLAAASLFGGVVGSGIAVGKNCAKPEDGGGA